MTYLSTVPLHRIRYIGEIIVNFYIQQSNIYIFIKYMYVSYFLHTDGMPINMSLYNTNMSLKSHLTFLKKGIIHTGKVCINFVHLRPVW